MQLTKTDFIQYLNCPKSLWLLKHDPVNYPNGKFSTFMQKLTREGYEVEAYVQKFLKNQKDRTVDFQKVFETDEGLLARLDAYEQASDGSTILYEIKSSTRVKTQSDHNHIKDACFQKICAEHTGQGIDRVILVHLNPEYEKNGKIDPSGLLVFADITDEVNQVLEETKAEIAAALEFLSLSKIPGGGCSCIAKSRRHHCDAFSKFNLDIPTSSIYSLPRLSSAKRDDFLSKNVIDLLDIPEGYPLSANQQIVLDAARTGMPVINYSAIQSFLDGMQFPLYFFDYETFASAVPLVDRTSPHKQFPVQYSVHVLDEDGLLHHHEFLERELCLPLPLIKQMESHIGNEGNIVSWHAPFEKKQNREMALWFPEKANFLNDLNDRMVDLEDVFKSDYVDIRFDGSTSIKKVLPVICPHLNYSTLEIQDGATAMDAWQNLINAKENKAEEIATNLLNYCKLDTLAMVEIYRFLISL